MAKEHYRNIRLGIFIMIGTISLIIALYFIGTKQNLFGSTFKVSAEFKNVNGLMKGNNVRFGGINIGTVSSVEIFSDSSIRVEMLLQKKIQKFIKKDAIVSIGTDGLLGNKLININTGNISSGIIEEGDVLQSLEDIEMNKLVRTLDVSSENIRVITSNLRNITDKINENNSLWSVLMDTIIAENVKSSVVNLKLLTNNSVYITGNLKNITEDIKEGRGSLGALITDTLLSSRINQTVVKLENISDSAAIITGDISHIVNQLKQGKGSIGVLLNDTTLIHNMNKSIENIESGTGKFDQNMEALKHSWPFKKYYRKQKKMNIQK